MTKKNLGVVIAFSVTLLAFAVVGTVIWRVGTAPVSDGTLGGREAAEDTRPTEAVSLADKAILELVIAPVMHEIDGKRVRMLAYNGSIPGPTLRVRQGTEVTLRLTNDGDMETTLHPHGLRLENASDGVPGMTQEPIAVGDTFEYHLRFPDPGAFWYHPHVRSDYGLEQGLYGAIIVEPADSTYWNPANREEVVMLDDVLLGGDGVLVPFPEDYADHALMGRYGNRIFINGKGRYDLSVRRGDVVRFYFTNAANVRPFSVGFSGAAAKVVGADLGRYEKESRAESLIIAPGERRVVEVLFDTPGEVAFLHRTPAREVQLGTVVVGEERTDISYVDSFRRLRENGTEQGVFAALRGYDTAVPDKTISISLSMGGMMGRGMAQQMDHGGMVSGVSADGIEWEDAMSVMNRGITSEAAEWRITDTATDKTNTDIRWDFHVGDAVKIRIENPHAGLHPMQHPIHFHGQQFTVIARDGVPEENRVWRDTVLLPAGETIDILLAVTNPGHWMAHCHIAEHAEAGMMLSYMVRGAWAGRVDEAPIP